MEEVTEIKNGQRKLVRRVRIPGYVLVRMDLTDESWGAVRTPRASPASSATPTSRSPLTPRRGLLDARARPLEPAEGGRGRRQAAAGQGRRLRGRRVGHRHGGPVRDAAGDDLRDQRRTRRSSRCSSRSSAARPRSSCRSTRSPRSDVQRPAVAQRAGRTTAIQSLGPDMPPKKKVTGCHQAADQGRRGHAGAADRPRAGPARRQHHGVLQGVQRRDRVAARQRHPRGDHGLRGPLLHLHHEDPAGRAS